MEKLTAVEKKLAELEAKFQCNPNALTEAALDLKEAVEKRGEQGNVKGEHHRVHAAVCFETRKRQQVFNILLQEPVLIRCF